MNLLGVVVQLKQRINGNLRADVFVIDGPEPVEAENILVIIAYVFHLIPILVSHTVINGFELDLWKETR